MAKRIESLLNKNVWSIAQKFQTRYKSQEIWLSAAVWALNNLSSSERDLAIDSANGFIDEESDNSNKQKSSSKSLQQTLKLIKEMTEIERQQPGTIYRVLDTEQQAVLQEFVKEVGPDFEQKKKKKKA